MKRSGPEDFYIHGIDAQKANRQFDVESQEAQEASEQIFIEISKKLDPDMKLRLSKRFEDAGSMQIGKGRRTDVVSYWSEQPDQPAIAWQITVGDSQKNIKEKFQLLKDEPYTTIEGYYIPRVIVLFDKQEVLEFESDQDLLRHQKLVEQYFDWSLRSLKFDEASTKDKKQKQIATNAIEHLMEIKLAWDQLIKTGRPQ